MNVSIQSCVHKKLPQYLVAPKEDHEDDTDQRKFETSHVYCLEIFNADSQMFFIISYVTLYKYTNIRSITSFTKIILFAEMVRREMELKSK